MITFKDWPLNEAIYKGMVGIMELIKFENTASPKDKQTFQTLLAAKKHKEALDHVQKTLGVKFQ